MTRNYNKHHILNVLHAKYQKHTVSKQIYLIYKH